MSDASTDLIDALRRIFVANGPLLEEQLLELVRADGADFGADPAATLAGLLDDNTDLMMTLFDERWAWLPALLNGRIFTHRLDAIEAPHDLLRFGPDLAPALMLIESETYQRLADGSPLAEASPTFNTDALTGRGVSVSDVEGDGALLLPAGRFAALGVGAGDLVGLQVTENGFDLVAVAQEQAEGIGAALAALLDENSPDQPALLDVAVWTLCGTDDTAFRATTTPLGESIAANGLACDGDWIARGGFDFAAWRLASSVGMIRGNYQLSEKQALAVFLTLRLYQRICGVLASIQAAGAPGAETDLSAAVGSNLDLEPDVPAAGAGGMTGRQALEYLAEPAVAIAVLAETHSEEESAAIGLGIFADTVERLAPRAARPALRWLRAKAHERLGDIAQAEISLQAAESLDPAWPLTLMSLARYASDRGDAEGGLGLLRRAGAAADHELVVVLERFRPAARTDIGRNDRCWCGSGQKYKACHLNNEQLPLEQRAVWLYHKAGGNLLEGDFGSLLFETAQVRAADWDSPDALGRALQDELAIDVVLFEGGAFADFVQTRGELLPEDERVLAGEWLGVRRSVHEVLNIAPGQGITVRDVSTGDVQEVHAPAASSQVAVGELYCARIVPVGDIKRIFGCFAPVLDEDREELLALLAADPDPVDLVAALSR